MPFSMANPMIFHVENRNVAEEKFQKCPRTPSLFVHGSLLDSLTSCGSDHPRSQTFFMSMLRKFSHDFCHISPVCHISCSGTCHISSCSTCHISCCKTCHISLSGTRHISSCSTCHISFCGTYHISYCDACHVSSCGTCHISRAVAWIYDKGRHN